MAARNFVTGKVSISGLFPILPKVPVMECDDSFCRIVRDTGDIQFDKVLRMFNRHEFDELRRMATEVGIVFNPENATKQNGLELVIGYHMLGAGAGMQRALARMLWDGNPANKTKSGSYREFEGFELQIENKVEIHDFVGVDEALNNIQAMEGVEFVLVAHPGLLWSLWGEPQEVHRVGDREFRLVADDSIPTELEQDEFTSSLYAIPVSPAGTEKPITRLEYVDYRYPIPFGGDTMFWTDAGFYVWKIDVDKWDTKLSIKNEGRLIVQQPELAHRFNLKYKLVALR